MVIRQTGMKNEAEHGLPKDFMNLAANEACLRLQIVQQIKSMIIEYNFFMASMSLTHSLSVVSLALYGQASRAISIG